jgi:hypothetical protein
MSRLIEHPWLAVRRTIKGGKDMKLKSGVQVHAPKRVDAF